MSVRPRAPANGVDQVFAPVAHDRLEGHRDANLVELFGQKSELVSWRYGVSISEPMAMISDFIEAASSS